MQGGRWDMSVWAACRTSREVGLDALERLSHRHEGEGLHLPIAIVRAEVRRQLQVIPFSKIRKFKMSQDMRGWILRQPGVEV